MSKDEWPCPDQMRIEELEAEVKRLKAEVKRLKALVPPEVGRSEGGVSQGTWSVYAEKVAAERDEARSEVKRLTKENAEMRLALTCAKDYMSDTSLEELRHASSVAAKFAFKFLSEEGGA